MEGRNGRMENAQSEKKKHPLRWLLVAFLPFALLAKAAYSIWQAFRRAKEKGFLTRDVASKESLGYRKEKRVVEVSAGIPITATVFIPPGEGPFPAIIMIHSWMFWRLQCDVLYAPSFARKGYVVLTYDTRGWGSSGGEVACVAPDREMVDLEDMITWLVSPQSGIPVDSERIGVTGVSYGGGHSFLIATRDERVKTVVPMSGWTDLDFALMPNGCWKAVWDLFLFVGALWAVKFDPKNDLVRWLRAVLSNEGLSEVKTELAQRSAIHSVDRVKCPVFIVHSWNDDLFEPNQILEFYEKLDAPKKLMITNGMHGIDGGRGDFLVPNVVWDEARKWFDYWLKDDRENGIGDGPEVTYYQPWTETMECTDGWPPPEAKPLKYFLRQYPASRSAGLLDLSLPADEEPPDLIINNTVSSLHSSGLPIVRLNALWGLPIFGTPFSVSPDSVSYTTAPLAEEKVMVGVPSVELRVASMTPECQINALLYDVSPKGFCKLVTHGAFTGDDMDGDSICELNLDLIASAYRFKKGHRVRLVLCASDPLYVFPSRVPSLYKIFHTSQTPSSLTIPFLEEKAS